MSGPVEGTLARWPERRIVAAMRAWRSGCRALLPWFRATPFAAAHHYRDRALGVPSPRTPPPAIERLASELPAARPQDLWILDLSGAAAIWLAYLLQRRRGLTVALGFNGWYDADGCLDGRAEIPLLLALGERLRGARSRAEAGLVFERDRLGPAPSAARLDNRYHLGDEDWPSAEYLHEAGRRRVRLFTEGEVAPDLSDWLEELRPRTAVDVVTGLETGVA